MLEFPVDTCSKMTAYNHCVSSLLFLNSLNSETCQIVGRFRSSPHSVASAAVFFLSTIDLSTVLGNFHSDG